MSDSHTQEPWKLIRHGNEQYPFPLSIHTTDDSRWIARDGTVSSMANARRIVACVNACAGIETETLKKFGVDGRDERVGFYACMTELEEANAHIDEAERLLREILELLVSWMPKDGHGDLIFASKAEADRYDTVRAFLDRSKP